MRILSLSSVNFLLHPGEKQMTWTDRFWQPVGQVRRYTLGGSLHLTENTRQGRPITLSAELPWSWLTIETLSQLESLASQANQTWSFSVDTNDDDVVDEVWPVAFRRDQGPLDFTPIDPRREYFTGTLYLVVV